MVLQFHDCIFKLTPCAIAYLAFVCLLDLVPSHIGRGFKLAMPASWAWLLSLKTKVQVRCKVKAIAKLSTGLYSGTQFLMHAAATSSCWAQSVDGNAWPRHHCVADPVDTSTCKCLFHLMDHVDNCSQIKETKHFRMRCLCTRHGSLWHDDVYFVVNFKAAHTSWSACSAPVVAECLLLACCMEASEEDLRAVADLVPDCNSKMLS